MDQLFASMDDYIASTVSKITSINQDDVLKQLIVQKTIYLHNELGKNDNFILIADKLPEFLDEQLKKHDYQLSVYTVIDCIFNATFINSLLQIIK